MREFRLLGIAMIAGGALLGVTSSDVLARCARLGFTVNDYGKDGPTKDAKSLLDKHIAKWTADKGIAKYTTGKKSVTCNLFLDFGFFDEHTCKAEATVCWNGEPGTKKPKGAGKPKAAAKKASAPTQAPAPAKREAESATTPTVAPITPRQPGSGLPKAPAPQKVKPQAT
jgi:hypothetical protein